MNCPFCEKEVINSKESVHGCIECIDNWTTNLEIDHDTD